MFIDFGTILGSLGAPFGSNVGPFSGNDFLSISGGPPESWWKSGADNVVLGPISKQIDCKTCRTAPSKLIAYRICRTATSRTAQDSHSRMPLTRRGRQISEKWDLENITHFGPKKSQGLPRYLP